jgi:sugar phosphate isomerase/epimerase
VQLGYNTNGFGFHRLEDALEIIADLGYRCAAITLDVHHLNPMREDWQAQAATISARLRALGLSCVVETGARFLLDPYRKHRPTLLDFDARLRRQFLTRAMHVAAVLEADCVSYWSGARTPERREIDDVLYRRLANHINELEHEAATIGVKLAIEPEPGFLIESMADYERLCLLMGHRLPLTLDIGHLKCVEEEAPEVFIRRYAKELVSVQLDDMRKGVHEHLQFGRGEVNFSPVFAALKEIGFAGPACVELSDGSRNAVTVARESIEFLAPLAAA